MKFSHLSVCCGLAVWGILATAPAAAQNTACALSGEYALSGSMLNTPPAQLGGSFVFTPPASCNPGAAGTVTIDAFWRSAQGAVQTFQRTVPYVVDGTIVTIGANLLVGGLAGIQDGLATAVALVGETVNGHAAATLAGTLVRQELPTSVVGPAGPPGPQGRPGPPVYRGRQVAHVRVDGMALQALLVLPVRLDLLAR